MKRLRTVIFSIFIIGFAGVSYGADNEETAQSWQEQATSTRESVMKVYGELEEIGDQDNPTAKDLIADAVRQLGEGDKYMAQGNEAMDAKDWEKANFGYNMAWQYYVKAATAGLNARRVLTGK